MRDISNLLKEKQWASEWTK